MRKIIKLILGIFIISILLNSCKKDENSISLESYFKYNNTEYNLSQGFYEIFYQSLDVYAIGITLSSSGINFGEVNGVISSASGTGHIIYFEIYSSRSDIDEGTYVYKDGSPEFEMFDVSMVAIDFNVQTLIGTELEITSGTLSIIKNENEYEITFDCIAEDGKSVTGYYKGNIGSVIFVETL